MLNIHDKKQAGGQMLGHIIGLYFCLTLYGGSGLRRGQWSSDTPFSPDKPLSCWFRVRTCKMENEWKASWNRCLISLKLAPKESRSQFGILMLYLSLSTDGYFY